MNPLPSHSYLLLHLDIISVDLAKLFHWIIFELSLDDPSLIKLSLISIKQFGPLMTLISLLIPYQKAFLLFHKLFYSSKSPFVTISNDLSFFYSISRLFRQIASPPDENNLVKCYLHLTLNTHDRKQCGKPNTMRCRLYLHITNRRLLE